MSSSSFGMGIREGALGACFARFGRPGLGKCPTGKCELGPTSHGCVHLDKKSLNTPHMHERRIRKSEGVGRGSKNIHLFGHHSMERYKEEHKNKQSSKQCMNGVKKKDFWALTLKERGQVMFFDEISFFIFLATSTKFRKKNHSGQASSSLFR